MMQLHQERVFCPVCISYSQKLTENKIPMQNIVKLLLKSEKNKKNKEKISVDLALKMCSHVTSPDLATEHNHTYCRVSEDTSS